MQRAGSVRALWARPLRPHRLLNPREVVITVAHGVILEHELTRDRRIGIERGLGGPIKVLVAECPDRRRRRGTVSLQQIECRLLRHSVVLLGVRGVHRMDIVHRDARHRFAAREGLCQLDLER